MIRPHRTPERQQQLALTDAPPVSHEERTRHLTPELQKLAIIVLKQRDGVRRALSMMTSGYADTTETVESAWAVLGEMEEIIRGDRFAELAERLEVLREATKTKLRVRSFPRIALDRVHDGLAVYREATTVSTD